MDKKLQAKVDMAILELVKISGDLSELQDTFNELIDEAYDNGNEDGYKDGCEDTEKITQKVSVEKK